MTNDDITTSKECTKVMLCWALEKVTALTFFGKECNELLVIRYIILGVTFPLHLLVTTF